MILSAEEAPLSDADLKRREADIAKQAAEWRYLKLNASLIGTQNELEKCQANLADTYHELSQIRDEIASIKLRAAHLFLDKKDVDARNEVAELISNIGGFRILQDKLYTDFLDFSQYLRSSLDILDVNVDSVFREILETKLHLVLGDLQKTQEYFRSERVNDFAEVLDECRILTVNSELGIAVLNAGRIHGVRPGTVWLVDSGGKTVKIKVVEVGRSLSAAFVIDGRLMMVKAGLAAKVLKTTETFVP